MYKNNIRTFTLLALLSCCTLRPGYEQDLRRAVTNAGGKAASLITLKDQIRAFKDRIDTRIIFLKKVLTNVDGIAGLFGQYRSEALSPEAQSLLDEGSKILGDNVLTKTVPNSISALDRLSEELGGIVGAPLDKQVLPIASKSDTELKSLVTKLDKNGKIDNILADTLRVILAIRAKIPRKASAKKPARKR